jgi:hypothetical protein
MTLMGVEQLQMYGIDKDTSLAYIYTDVVVKPSKAIFVDMAIPDWIQGGTLPPVMDNLVMI